MLPSGAQGRYCVDEAHVWFFNSSLVQRTNRRSPTLLLMHAPAASNIAVTVYKDLRHQILSGELAAGARLPGERELAAKYGTNRNTLREAVRRLEQARLVTVRHGQGVTVTDFRKTGTMELLAAFLETASDMGEVVKMLEDILPARLMVIEFAGRLAARRANEKDHERLQSITEELVAAFDRGDPVIVAHGFQQWLDAVIDAGHSVPVRWIANPFLEAYRDLMDLFPALWVLEPSFPQHLRDFLRSLIAADESGLVKVTRDYYRRIDAALLRALDGALAVPKQASASDSARPKEPVREAEPATRSDDPDPAP
jgi:DNA-binding FadR family transcriptional regulator